MLDFDWDWEQDSYQDFNFDLHLTLDMNIYNCTLQLFQWLLELWVKPQLVIALELSHN